jgi:hypothetical protein
MRYLLSAASTVTYGTHSIIKIFKPEAVSIQAIRAENTE